MFRYPTDAKSMVVYAQQNLTTLTKKDGRVKRRYFEYVENKSADFLRDSTEYTYFKDNLVVDRMAGISDLHRFRFGFNAIKGFRTFTMHDEPFDY